MLEDYRIKSWNGSLGVSRSARHERPDDGI